MQFYNFLGTCPQTLLSQSILWAPLLVFAWDPSKPLASLTMGFGPSKLPTLLYSSGMTLDRAMLYSIRVVSHLRIIHFSGKKSELCSGWCSVEFTTGNLMFVKKNYLFLWSFSVFTFACWCLTFWQSCENVNLRPCIKLYMSGYGLKVRHKFCQIGEWSHSHLSQV